MNRFIAVQPLFYGKPSSPLARSLRGAASVLLMVCCVLVGPAPAAGGINGNFETGNLAGWDVNLLIPLLSNPAAVDVTPVGGSLVGAVNFSSSVGGHYAGSLSQDFFTGAATELTFDIGFSAMAPVAPGDPNVVDAMDVLVQNLDTNTTIVHTLHIENLPGEALDVRTSGLPFHSFAILPGSNTHIRLALLMDFRTLDGVPSSAQLLLDNVTLVPEPSTWVLAMGTALSLGSTSWLRRRRSSRGLF